VTSNGDEPVQNLLFISLIFFFYYLALFNEFWKKVFAIPVLTTIGGMCYSVYLWHYPIISAFGRYFLQLKTTDHYAGKLIIFCLLMFIPVLIISGLFFLYVEKPCMAKDWHKKLLLKFGINKPKAINTA
jgi:peptidoglycan/LPS O-acetylase OafA/YrhL